MTQPETRCLICGADDFRSACEKAGTRYVQCAGCGVVRQYPYPTADEIARYYANYQSHKSSTSVYLTDAGFDVFRRDKLLTFGDLGIPADGFTGKRICDVGCASGQFLQLMTELGATAPFGIDVSKECVDIAQSRGLACEEGNFLEVQRTFDVITLWHVVEHLPTPQAFIQHAYECLAPGGWLLIETPVIGAISEAFGADWRYYMPTEHINLFPMEALVKLCNDTGFSLRSFTRFGSGNDSDKIPRPNKRAMDSIAKKFGFGDTLALWLVKNTSSTTGTH